MNPALIGIGIFLGIIVGVGGAFLLILIKNNALKKSALKKIEKQDLKFNTNEKSVDFFGNVKKEAGKDKKKEDVVEEKKVEKKKSKKKVRVKKTKKGKKK